MSRTVRRKNTKSHFSTGYEYRRIHGTWIYHKLSEKELKKAISIWYSDSNYKTGLHNQETDIVHRMNCKQELQRWKKNPDYEVQIYRKVLRDWD